MTGVFILFDNESIPIFHGDFFPHYSDRYIMRYCFSRLALGLCLLMLLWATTRASANETPGCTDCPGGSAEATINVTFCSMGVTYNVDVTYCTKTYSPPQLGLPCATNTGIDKYTVIKKICPSGTTLPPTARVSPSVPTMDVFSIPMRTVKSVLDVHEMSRRVTVCLSGCHQRESL